MRKLTIISMVILLALWILTGESRAEGMADYLILEDIGIYKLAQSEKMFAGVPPIGGPKTEDGPGALRATHFSLDHTDKTYEVLYWNEGDNVASPNVVVTQHAGGESDRWLLHEVEAAIGSYDVLFTFDAMVKEVDGNKIFTYLGGTRYAWISNNVVVHIEYTDQYLTYPEPWEVVRAYLQKFPSTITKTNSDMKSITQSQKWFRDEMERRLWLCDKWNEAYAAGKASKEQLLSELNGNMETFLEIRKKYYETDYGDDINILWDYQYTTQDVEGMKKKLAEYKAWWAIHKEDTPAAPLRNLLNKLIRKIK